MDQILLISVAGKIISFILLHEKFLQFDWPRAVVYLQCNIYMWKLQTFCGYKYKQIIAWFVHDIWHKYHPWYFKMTLSQISLASRLRKLRLTIANYHIWYLCQISLQIMLLPRQTWSNVNVCLFFLLVAAFIALNGELQSALRLSLFCYIFP